MVVNKLGRWLAIAGYDGAAQGCLVMNLRECVEATTCLGIRVTREVFQCDKIVFV